MRIKSKKAEVTKKLAIEKKTLKTEADMKKVNDWVAKNLQTVIEKSQIIKRKVALLITDRNATKKCQSNGKASMDVKLEDNPKLKK